tara:strand:- start:1147 stop:2442 length:1296 start_codon:yes stop_codon:yes gene_type:complete
MNEYDSNRIYDMAKRIEYYKTLNLDEADCLVINTCHIREKATEKLYHEVGRVKKRFKNKKKPIVIVSGCVAQAEGQILLKKENYIDAVIGPQSYQKFQTVINEVEKKNQSVNFTEFSTEEKFDKLNIYKNSDNKVTSFLTIQEGCDKFCKFCVVPYTRGPEFSRPVNEIVKEAEDLVANGSREVILLGQNVNAYQNDGKKLSNLISEISKIKKINRIRYTTSHPIDFSDDLIESHKNISKLMPMIHLPVQSGSNKILKNMNRKHTVEDYIDLINTLKKNKPAIKFSSDFIIGYPGETEQDFEKTVKLMRSIKFINSYSFIFSRRPGTPASKLEEIPSNVSKKRLSYFQKIADEIKMEYRKNLFNKKSLVMFENRLNDGKGFFGKDEYSNPVIVQSRDNLAGKVVEVNITGGDKNTLIGKINQGVSKKDCAA